MTTSSADVLRRAMQRLFRHFGALAAEATPCGKPLSMAHAHALMALLEHGELTQQALGKELNIDKSNVARLCEKMVEAGHARQRTNEVDGRSRLISLGVQGKRLAREVDTASRARFEALLAALPKGRQREIVRALVDLAAALETTLHRPLDSLPRVGGSSSARVKMVVA